MSDNWISVKDRLPRDHLDVLLYEKYSDSPILVGYMNNGEWRINKEALISTAGIIEDNIIQEDITHWRYVPSPPN